MDRRIVFEIIGSRVEKKEFPDETSESEEAGDDDNFQQLLSLAEEVK